MGRKIEIKIGKLVFESKKEAKEYYTKILNKYRKGEQLKGNDLNQVKDLLLLHPRAEDKIGSGIKSILVQQGFNSKNKCFHVVRIDNSIEDFSIHKCIDGEDSLFNQFSIACRRAVHDDLYVLKVNYFKEKGDKEKKVVCGISKKKISFEQSHIDHREPFTFSAIVHFFIQAHNLDLSKIQYKKDGKYGHEFADNKLAEQFRKWHKKNARLRIISAQSNLSKAYLGRISKTSQDQLL